MTFDDANCNKLKSLLVFETNIYSISTTVYSYNAVIMKALARTFKKHYYRSWNKLTSLFCEMFLKWILNLETVTKNASILAIEQRAMCIVFINIDWKIVNKDI